MLTKGRRKYIATICERVVTVAFAGVFASELFMNLTIGLKMLLIPCIAVIVLLGFWAAIE